MGSESLLSREEEVEIAKRIEVGEQEIARVVLHAPIIVSELISMGEDLKSGKVAVREIIGGIDDEETIDEDYYIKNVLSLIAKIKKSEQKKRDVLKKLAQKHLTQDKRKELHKKIDQKNEISGSYNFSTDEAFFGYRRTFSGSWRASARYNVQSSCGEYTLDRIFKADDDGQEGILSMMHCPKKDIAKVLYDQGQWNMSVGMKTNSWVGGLLPIPSLDSMHVKYTHLFIV